MNVIRELENVLAEEQHCLLNGNYADLLEIATRKSSLADHLKSISGTLDRDDCRRVVDKAAYNEALLRSAQRGIQAAITQLGQIASGEHQSTYSRGGKRSPLSRTPSSLIQKL